MKIIDQLLVIDQQKLGTKALSLWFMKYSLE